MTKLHASFWTKLEIIHGLKTSQAWTNQMMFALIMLDYILWSTKAEPLFKVISFDHIIPLGKLPSKQCSTTNKENESKKKGNKMKDSS